MPRDQRDSSQTHARWSRRRYLATSTIAITGLTGCLSSPTQPQGVTPDPTATTQRTETPTPANGPPTADRRLPQAYDIDELNNRAISGGVPPDGIPSIDDPEFTTADNPPATIEAEDPVFGVVLNGEAKAYPQYVLVWHEIVNDVFSDIPVAVTYCPLTGTAQGFYRGDTTFGVSGMLINNNLVMYDRVHAGWWPQILAFGIQGPQTGEYLTEFQVIWTTWNRWSACYPDSLVLTEDTGHARNYGQDPYGSYNPPAGYYAGGDPLVQPLTSNDQYGLKTVMLGARTIDGAVAVEKDWLREQTLVGGIVNDTPYCAVYDPTLDTGYLYRDADHTTIKSDNERFVVEDETYAPAELPFERVIAFDAMWFAWYGYYPSTTLLE